MIRENWKEHSNPADMVRSAGLAYDADEEGERVIYCPVCKDFESLRGGGNNMKKGRRLCDLRKFIDKHMYYMHHLVALEERDKELRRNLRRTRPPG